MFILFLPRALRLGRRRALAVCALMLHASSASATLQAQQPVVDRLRRDITFLVDARLAGRGTGTPGNDSAAAYIAATYAGLGLRPVQADSAGECAAAKVPVRCFLQPFIARRVVIVADGRPDAMPTQNVAALIRGRDATLRGQMIVVGAHFDHLGRSPVGALDPEAKNAMRPGADDNASGTAAVMELARAFAARPPRRSVIVANFSGEELGQLGSQWFVEHSPVSLDSIVAMINFDMVGRLRNDNLIVYGVATAKELSSLLDSANVRPPLSIDARGYGWGDSDQRPFYAMGIPVLHFFTGFHEDYHRATDVAEKLAIPGEARVVAVAERAIRLIADRPARLTPVRISAQRERVRTR